jgi:hypothetical protein
MADERLQARLSELRRDYDVGEARLREMVQQEATLRETLLRISGAIQVLEELGAATTAKPGAQATAPSAPADDGSPPGPQILTVP